MEAAASALMPQTGGTAEAENKQTGGAAKPEDKQTDLSTTDKFTAFGEQYSLTERERKCSGHCFPQAKMCRILHIHSVSHGQQSIVISRI